MMVDFIRYRKYCTEQGERNIALNAQYEVAENGGEGHVQK